MAAPDTQNRAVAGPEGLCLVAKSGCPVRREGLCLDFFHYFSTFKRRMDSSSHIFHPPPLPLLIIGVGAAGIIAAWRAAQLGAQVLLLERNRKPGIKLLISGGGKCNITHEGRMEDIRRAFRPHEARFLRPRSSLLEQRHPGDA